MTDDKLEFHLNLQVQQFTKSMAKAAKEFEAGMGGMKKQAKTQAKSIEQAINLFGVKSFKKVNAEIKSLDKAYKTLKNSGTLSAKEIAKAYTLTKDKIAALKQETNGWASSYRCGSCWNEYLCFKISDCQ